MVWSRTTAHSYNNNNNQLMTIDIKQYFIKVSLCIGRMPLLFVQKAQESARMLVRRSQVFSLEDGFTLLLRVVEQQCKKGFVGFQASK